VRHLSLDEGKRKFCLLRNKKSKENLKDKLERFSFWNVEKKNLSGRK